MVLLSVGCALFSQHQGLLEHQTPDARITSAHLRVWTYDFILDYADRIEEAADKIKAQEASPEIKRNSLLWKINATQAGFRAASRRDALSSFADVWVLCRQMTMFFETGAGKESFGSSQEIAVITSKGLEVRLEEIRVAMVKPEAAERRLHEGRAFVGSFAQEHPIKSLYFQRDSLGGRSDTIALPESSGFGALAAGMEQDVLTLQRLLSVYMEYLPTFARWQAELMVSDIERGELVGESMAVMKEMPILVREAMTKHMPQLMSHEMTRALSALTLERVNAMSGLERMRVSTLDFAEQQRMAVVAEIDRQRVATIRDVSEERKAALKEVQAIARDSTDSALSIGKELIDHLFWRLAALAGGIALCVVIGAGAVVMVMRTRDGKA